MSLAMLCGAALLLAALAGLFYTGLAIVAVERFQRMSMHAAADPEPVSLLKPLHGAEPRLAENLATFLDQDWPAPVELIAGIQDPADPAIAAARTLPQSGDRHVRLVVDPTPHGANAKIANLINMTHAAEHDLIILSDSDMSVPRDYLRRIAATLALPNVGAVTCAYRGRGEAGFWSVLAAASSSYHFLPSVLVGLALRRGQACMGSTIALRSAELAAIGGFAAFADVLADDHAIGAAIRRTGRDVAVAPILLVHGASETSFAALVRHELRWALTVRRLVPFGDYLGSAITHPVPLALLACAFVPRAGVCMLAAALLGRALLWRQVDRWAGTATAPWWMLPLRDILSFGLYLASFAARSVDWRGQRLRVDALGRIAREPETSS